MNHLEVELIPDYREIAGKKLFLSFDITIDGVSPLKCDDDCCDIHEFIMSTRQDGTYFPWTCSCGIPGCAGYFYGAQVRMVDDIIYWTDQDAGKHHAFDADELKRIALTLEDEFKRWAYHAKSTGVELNVWPAWSIEHLLSALGGDFK